MTKEALTEALGKEIRSRRRQKKLTQTGLALRADVHLNTISLIERAKTFGGIDALFDIARALGISLSQLLKAAEDRADGR
ncbi:XRE family transcriptional regulator [Burkholderia multivorans]|uniref:XRE family transcriptional regulator n=1 Tax=Burkholderia multivorans TaxID=87883 RepID=A0AB37AS49_9BURK|nr:helix-turn-helix transcriptional regulator [Burkholderia multivorans]PRE45367.1 XRE family transcriptional regulator [Burkholderia multivorans]PRE52053.1 XRE family transcriptional regulator [Burkholderia multivorans]PRG58090.1 XRE family transcriptional regulator [Burkholderia multivorans]